MNKKFVSNIMYNLIATAVPLIILQLFIMPYWAKRMPSEEYGLIVTIISLITMISVCIGNSLCSIRLLDYNNVETKDSYGDFGRLVIFYLLINFIIIYSYIWYYRQKISLNHVLLLLLLANLSLIKEYSLSLFWIEFNYRKVLVNNIVLTLGYIVGTILFYYSGYWELTQITGIVFSLLHVIKNSSIKLLPLNKESHFKHIYKKTTILIISNIIGRALQYIDKLILLPLLGGKIVSIYYCSTLLGKLVPMITNPISNVFLSYLSRKKDFAASKMKTLIFTSFIVSFWGYLLSLLITKPILGALYPQWITEILKYTAITNLSGILMGVCAMYSPILLKFCDIKWQIVINTSSVAVYLIITFFLMKKWGIMGFCIGILISYCIKLALMISIFYSQSLRNKQ